MPIPKPDPDDDQQSWMERCMSNDTMLEEYPDNDQRAAVCFDIWRRRDEKAVGFRDLEVKFSAPSDAGEFSGIASVFGEVDLVGDTIAPGAFRKSLAAHRRAGRMPLLLWAHDLTAPIGRWLDIRETAQGLAVRGKLILDTVRGREAYTLLKERALDGLSIGFRTVKAARMKTGRLLQEVELAEISLVTLPALASARVMSVKSTPRREAVQPSEGQSHAARFAHAGRRSGPRRISPRSVAARAARDAGSLRR